MAYVSHLANRWNSLLSVAIVSARYAVCKDGIAHSSPAIQTDRQTQMKSEKKKRWTQCLLSLSLCVCVCWSVYANRDVKNLLLINYVYLFIIFLKQLRSTTQRFVQSCRHCCCCCCHHRTLSALSRLRPGITMLSLLLLCSLTFSLFLFFINLAKERWKNTLYKCCWQRTATADRGQRTVGQRTVRQWDKGQTIADVPHS